MGRTDRPANDRVLEVELLQMVPVVSAVLGSVAGLPAVQAALCHFNVMVKGTSQLFVAGPPVVKAGLGIDITKEELGNEDVQVRQSGVVANLADGSHLHSPLCPSLNTLARCRPAPNRKTLRAAKASDRHTRDRRRVFAL
jgi:acetyl-CoA carboxylase carboxyltransferase component